MTPRTRRASIMGGAGEAYLLRDDFTTAQAAATVNATPAVPGPGGARTLVDTEDKLSISGGQLVCAGGKATPGYNDPRIRWPLFTRSAGLAMLSYVQPVGGGIWPFGFSRSATTHGMANGEGLFLYAGGIWHGGGATYLYATYTVGQWYYICEILRSFGHLILIKGGPEYPNWTLIKVYQASSSDQYPNFSNYNEQFKVDTVRIPVSPVYIKPLASDSFNRANAPALGISDGAQDEQKPLNYPTWADVLGTFGITGNAAKCSALDAGGLGITILDVSSTNPYIICHPVYSAGSVGVVFWYTDVNNYCKLIHDGTSWILTTVIAGVESAPIISVEVAIGYWITIRVSGTSVWVHSDDVIMDGVKTISTVTPTSKIGLITNNTGNTYDNINVFDVGTGGRYNQIDRFFR